MSKNILAISDMAELRQLRNADIGARSLTNAEIRHILELCGALWLHSGNPENPHAELTSGKCSNGFVDVLRMLRFTNLCRIFGFQMFLKIAEKAREFGLDSENIASWVVGSDHAGAAFSQSVATWMDAMHDFTVKGPDKTQLWERFTIEPGETVLQVEELMTTAGTLQAVRAGIRKGNPHPVTFVPFAAVLVHRSEVTEIEGAPVVHLVHYNIRTWEPEECPLCKAGSKRVRPKTHWDELTPVVNAGA